jgi:hypothetical protein
VWGLSNVITSEINVDDVIQRSSMEDNLFCADCWYNPARPNPAPLLQKDAD